MKYIIKQEGFSLVIVMVFIALLSSLAIIAVRMSGFTVTSIYGEENAKQAYYIAEAAYQDALFRLNQNTAWRGNLNNQPFAGGSYSLDVSQANPIDDLTITAVGSVGGTDRTIVRVIPPPVKPFIIVAYAGTGVAGSSGDSGAALSATLNKPRGLSKNTAGNVYIADTGNHYIRYVDVVLRKIYYFAGKKGQSGYTCDNCNPATAKMNSPEGLFIDLTGNVFFADTGNHIVRKIIAGGNIVTIAGIATSSGFTGDSGLATNAKLNSPRDVIVDTIGNVYIADTSNCRIRKVAAVTAIITTFAGTGSCGLLGDGGLATNARINRPRGLAFDTTGGNMYFADTSNNRIRKINMITKIITTVAGTSGGFAGDGGLATIAKLNQPQGVAINQFGAIYIADTGNNRIRKVDPATGNISTHAGIGTAGSTGDGGVATAAQLNAPARLIAYDDVDGHLLISDTNNNRVREVTSVY